MFLISNNVMNCNTARKEIKIAQSDNNNNRGHQRALGSTLSNLHQTRPVEGGGDYYTFKLFMRVAAAPTRRKEKKIHWLISIGGRKRRRRRKKKPVSLLNYHTSCVGKM